MHTVGIDSGRERRGGGETKEQWLGDKIVNKMNLNLIPCFIISCVVTLSHSTRDKKTRWHKIFAYMTQKRVGHMCQYTVYTYEYGSHRHLKTHIDYIEKIPVLLMTFLHWGLTPPSTFFVSVPSVSVCVSVWVHIHELWTQCNAVCWFSHSKIPLSDEISFWLMVISSGGKSLIAAEQFKMNKRELEHDDPCLSALCVIKYELDTYIICICMMMRVCVCICVCTKVNKEKQQRSAVSYARKSQINPYQQQ